MKLKHFNITSPGTSPPENEGWEPTWYGYYEMTKCETPDRRKEYLENDREIHAKGMLTEADFERECLLNILADIDKEDVTMFELGAGWGRMSMALAGTIDFQIIPLQIKTYRCLAVEAEPVHFQWTEEHFEKQGINATAIHVAVSDKGGYCRFNASLNPKTCYGQAINTLFLNNWIPNIGGIMNFFSRKTIRVPAFTIDQLMKNFKFDHVNIIDIDVQGAEFEVVSGAVNSIRNHQIDYWLIGTHNSILNDKIAELLETDYELIVNLYPNNIGRIDGFNPVDCHDGIQLFRSKNLP